MFVAMAGPVKAVLKMSRLSRGKKSEPGKCGPLRLCVLGDKDNRI